MKKWNKVLITISILLTFSINGRSQNLLLRAMNGFNDLTEGITRFFTSGKTVDSVINSEKAKNMASELYRDVGDLILVKDSILFTLQNSSFNQAKYKSWIATLQSKLDTIRSTLKKYQPLIAATGINTQTLDYELKQDFLQKAQSLELAAGLLDNPGSESSVKETLIIYFKSCINILKNVQGTLKQFKP